MNVAIYLHVSSEQQAEPQLSIPAQREPLQQHAVQNAWNNHVIYKSLLKS